MPRDANKVERAVPAPSHYSCAEFSTANLPRADQLDAYRAFITPTYDVMPTRGVADGYEFTRKAMVLGGLMLVTCTRDGFEGTRSADHIRRDQSDAFLVYCNLAGAAAMECDDEYRDVRPGSLLIRDMTRPVRTRTESDSVIMLSVPRDTITAMVGDTNPLHCHLSGSAMGYLLRDHLISVCREMDGISAAQAAPIADAIELLLGAALLPTRDRLVEAARPVNDLLRRRATRYMARNLLSPSLTPDRIATETGVSRRKLYQLFEANGGVIREIQRLRLERARAALSDPSHVRKVKEVAFAHGFDSEAQFCKTFKRRFGLTPSEASLVDRAAQSTGDGASIPAGPAPALVAMVSR
jgi:AraC-like DNA-binding protein